MTDAIPDSMDVAVAGGSIAGLCAGTALRAAGFDVHVLERSPERLTGRGAGIVVQPDLLHLLALVGAPRAAGPPPARSARACRWPRACPDGRTCRSASRRGGRSTRRCRPRLPDARYHVGAAAHIDSATRDGVSLRVG